MKQEVYDELYTRAETDPVGVYTEICGENWTLGLVLYIPDYMLKSVVKWVLFGSAPGSFLSAVVMGDLFGAYRAADSTNVNIVYNYVNFFYNYAPSNCYGSKENANRWNKERGLLGQQLEDTSDAV